MSINGDSKADDFRQRLLQQGLRYSDFLQSLRSIEIRNFVKKNSRSLFVSNILMFILASFEGLQSIAILGFISMIAGGSSQAATSGSGLSDIFEYLNLDDLDLKGFLVFMIILAVGIGAIRMILIYVEESLKTQLQRDLRLSIFDKIFRLRLSKINQVQSGELVFLINAEVSRFSNILRYYSEFGVNLIQLIVVVLLLAKTNWILTVFVIPVGIIYFLAGVYLDRIVKIHAIESNYRQMKLVNFFTQMLYGIKVIHLGSMQESEKNELKKTHSYFEQINTKLNVILGLGKLLKDFTGILILLIVWIFIGTKSTSQILSPADLAAFMFLLVRSLTHIAACQGAKSALIAMYAPLKRVIDFLQDTDEESLFLKERHGHKMTVKEIHRLELDSIHMNYDEKKVLNGVSAQFERGKTYALVGSSGAGKTSTIEILSLLLKQNSGSIRVNGILSDDLNLDAVRSRMTYMNQEPIIFHDSLKINLSYFKPQATDAELVSILNNVRLDEFFKGLGSDWNYVLGERGLSVSGGERQRIGLGRVLLRDFDVLILDEATNSLDQKTEAHIYAYLNSIKHDKIIIVIAHRLSAVKDFDEILVFQKGQLIERGKHSNLIGSQSVYQQLFLAQEEQVK